MQKTLLYSIAIITFCILIVGLAILNQKKSDNRQNLKQASDDNELYYLRGLFNVGIESENLGINDAKLFYGNDSVLIPISQLLETPQLIYRVSGNMCSPCIEFGFQQMKTIFGKLGCESKAIIVSSDMSPLEKKRLYESNCYSLVNNEPLFLNLPMEEYSIPFFFITDRSLRIKMLFIPDKANPQYTEKYLLTVFHYLKSRE